MLQSVRISLVLLILFTLILCVAYPAFITGISNVVMRDKAEGSLIREGDKVVGSTLIGQSFSDPKYFWGRLSATGPVPYNAAASSGSNLGSAADALEKNVKARIDELNKYPHPQGKIPVDLVTASGSGLDPDISPAAAEYQAERIAKSRNMNVQTVRDIVKQNTQGRQFGVLGQERINVLLLNKSLDATLTK